MAHIKRPKGSASRTSGWPRGVHSPLAGEPAEATGAAVETLSAGPVAAIPRKTVLLGLAATTVGAGVGSLSPVATAVAQQLPSPISGSDGRVSVASTGATGDGVTDDTRAIRAAIVAAAGGETYFPPGAYVVDGLLVDTTAHLQLDPATTLVAKENSPSGVMIQFTGVELVIRGGTIDGNRTHQTGRPVIVSGNVQHGKSIDIAEVHFKGTVKAALYLANFGGFASVERCLFTDQAEHTGVLNAGVSMIVCVISGEPGVKGLVRFNQNRAIGTSTPREAGSNPGGVFIAPNTADAPEVGNLTTLEAGRNYFFGYGQNLAGNTISAIHLYRGTSACRITENYFEESSISSISAKSVTDFVCSNNVFIGGATSLQNPVNEGVIAYVPGYGAGSVVQPRAVITGNIIERAGGQTSNVRQNGISIHGTNTSHGTDIVVAGNVINGGGVGIHIVYVDDITLMGNILKPKSAGVQAYYVRDIVVSGNTVRCESGAALGSQGGITLGYLTGSALVSDNVVETHNGHGFLAVTGMATARVTLQGNRFQHECAGHYAAVLRGMSYLKISGNEFAATAGTALDVRADAAANKIGRLAYDLTNTISSGPVNFVWSDIVAAVGQLRASRSPVGLVTAGEVGTTYQQTDGTGDGLLWVALATTSTGWAKVLASPLSGASGNRLLGMTYDPLSANVGQLTGPPGVLHLSKLLVTGGGSVDKVLFTVSKPGTGLIPGQCRVGIYDAAGALLAQTADLSAIFAKQGSVAVPLTSRTPAVPPGTALFVALLWRGLTGPELLGAPGGMANIGITSAAEARYSTAGKGLVTLPSTRPTPVLCTVAPWIGVA